MPNPWLYRLLPFLNWFPMSPRAVRGDLIAGLSVAVVLIPQGMAYAALAGLHDVGHAGRHDGAMEGARIAHRDR